MTTQKKLEEKQIPFCLFHEKADCICMEPVTDPKTLRVRLEHFISLSRAQLKYGTNTIASEVLEAKIDQSILRLQKL